MKPVPIRAVRAGLGVLLGLVGVFLPSVAVHASQPAARPRGVIAPNSVASHLYAQSNSNGGDVWEYSGGPMNWWRVGDPASVIYGGGFGLFAKPPYPNDTKLWRYSGNLMDWQLVDDATLAADYAATNNSIYKRDNGVYEYAGLPLQWIRIGDWAPYLYAGGVTLLATDQTTGALYRYNGSPGSWSPIGGPGTDFCVNDVAIYAMSPRGSANEGVYQYNGSGTSWTKIGDPAGKIYCGGSRLLATDKYNGDVYLYGGTPGEWSKIGGQGAKFVIAGNNAIYASNWNSGVWQWSGSGTLWWKIGDPVMDIVAAS